MKHSHYGFLMSKKLPALLFTVDLSSFTIIHYNFLSYLAFFTRFFPYLYKAHAFKLTFALRTKDHYAPVNKFPKLSLLKIPHSLTDLTALKPLFCHKNHSVEF